MLSNGLGCGVECVLSGHFGARWPKALPGEPRVIRVSGRICRRARLYVFSLPLSFSFFFFFSTSIFLSLSLCPSLFLPLSFSPTFSFLLLSVSPFSVCPLLPTPLPPSASLASRNVNTFVFQCVLRLGMRKFSFCK